jgi:hypothetical protein
MSEARAATAASAANGEPLSIEQVLAAEAGAIHGDTADTRTLASQAKDQATQEKRMRLNEDRRGDHDRSEPEFQPRDEFYRVLNKLNRAALCCSGGGIRSATFCLGVVQALAACHVDDFKEPPAAATASEQPAPKTAERKPEQSLLGRFHYLSTVSGGGYFGSWLSAWRARCGFDAVVSNLTGRPNGPDIEPPELSWLRAYSNYLTPRVGVISADSWAAVAITVRNLILNWLVIIPVVCIALLALKLVATASVAFAHDSLESSMIVIGRFGVFFLVVAQAFTNWQRPAMATHRGNATEWAFIFGDLIWALASAIFLTVFFSSKYYFSLSTDKAADLVAQRFGTAEVLAWVGADPNVKFFVAMAVAGLLIYAIGWIAGRIVGWVGACLGGPASSKGWRDFISWASSGLVYGALVGLGAYLFHLLTPYPVDPSKVCILLVALTLGVPWILASQLVAEIVFVGLSSYEEGGDADREWLGRAAGWLAVAAILWALTAFLVFVGGYFVQSAGFASLTHQIVVALGGVAGIVSGVATALFGSSAKTAAKPSTGNQAGLQGKAYDVGLAVAGPVFVAVLIIALSVLLDKLLLAQALVDILQLADNATTAQMLSDALWWLRLGLGVVLAVGLLASYCVNINRFSLHALYRNRLTRAYLGASNQQRNPDSFSGFDFKDNIRVHELWPKKDPKVNVNRLFHVINITLNVVSTKRLAWQERKAESFTVSPLHCGSAYLGFRASEDYGDGPETGWERAAVARGDRDQGIALGTAVAISGAAVSPNMGYNSSPSIALLLTLFNVRLGWWLGNPGRAGKNTYKKDGPRFAARPLFAEAFGQTNDTSPYVYLSDGGHFENLGLYEMVRRRCRLAIVIDAGCDPDFAFADLGNAVRKIYIDLGIRITFNHLQALKNRPSPKLLSRVVRDAAALATLVKVDPPGETPYYAIGTIHYNDADGGTAEDGTIIYIKPAYHGTEAAGIRAYATANPEFPHESTLDQFFTESQFESYRSLGLDIAKGVLQDPKVKSILARYLHGPTPSTTA